MKKQLIKALTLALAISFLQESTLAQKTKGVRGRRVIQSQGCILSKVDVQLEDQTSEEYWHCELQSSDASETSTRFVVLEGLDDLDLDAEAISGRTTLLIEGAVIADGRLKAPEGAVRKFGKVEKRGPSEANKKRKQEGEGKQARQLAPLQTDMKKVLAVRVKAPDSTTTASLETLRGDIFGIGQGETAVTLSERFKSCSYGQVLMTPYSGQTASGFTVENGVVEIEISTLVSEQDSHTIKNAVTQALSSLLGISDLSAQFDHVMLCLPPGTSGGWIAYGYLNSWLTVYNDDWCRYPSGQVHELGHNLGLNHASEGDNMYGDQTGLMGYSYASLTTKMCYNPAKSWQLGWYPMKQEILDFSQRGGFSGSLVGVTDYQHVDAHGKHVILRIPGSTEDLFLGFNRNHGINSNTQEAWNQVTVQGQLGANRSFLRAKLSAGAEYVVTDFHNNKDLIIKVTAINIMQTPAIADIVVQLEGCPPGQCGTECHVLCVPDPTPSPTYAPKDPTAAPKDPTQSPTDTPKEPTSSPTDSPKDPTPSPTDAPKHPTSSPTDAPKNPTLSPTAAPKDPSPSPTAAPKDPTSSPTDAPKDPTPSPTAAPKNPTPFPTNAPKDPTSSPTAAPKDPTSSPTDAPKNPTSSPTAVPKNPTPSPTIAPKDPTPSPTDVPQDPTLKPSSLEWKDIIQVEDFERGLVVFKARGKYAKINTKVVMNELGSRKSLEIKGDTSWSQIYTHESFFVGDYQELQVGFWYSSVNAAAGDSFGVEISSDNGNTWDTVHDYSRDKEWPSDKIWYNGTKEFKKPDGAQWITLRIMAAVKSKGALYFENVSLEGR